MKHRHRRSFRLAILWLGFAISPAASGLAETSLPGVAVEEVGGGSALEKAGLRSGDLLLAWERPAASQGELWGEIRTVFDWSQVMTGQAPRGTVRLRGERSGAATLFEVPRGVWEARVRPRLAADALTMYTEGRQRIDAGDVEGGVALWRRLAAGVKPDLQCWILLRIGEAWARGRQGGKARDALQEALAAAPDAQAQVAVWEALGESYQYAREMARAEAGFHSALEIAEAAWGESLQTAGTMIRLGTILRLRNRLDAAEQFLGRALEIRQREAPDSLEVADSLHHLFKVAAERQDFEAMSELNRRALAIQKRWPPDTLVMADTLNDQSILAMDQGRFGEAAAALQRALAILEKRSPESLQMAVSLSYLGLVARLLGEMDSALELLRHSLAIREKLAPESLGTAAILSNLGAIARERGDLKAARDYFQRALAMWQKTVPEGIDVPTNLNALGIVARLQGHLDEASSLHRRALKLGERSSLSGDRAFSLSCLGLVAEARGDLRLALEFHQQAEAIFERLAPGTIDQVLTLRQLGLLYRRTGRPDQAARFLARAVDELESQVGKLGGSQDLQATFRARYEDIYRDAVEVELERGHSAEAFHLVERSRARSFLALLSERDLAFPGELPAGLERSRRDNAARYDQTLRELARWAPEAGEEARESFHRELSRLRGERDLIAAEIRQASPRLAALRQPQPLDLAAARKVLDPGTLALSYSIGKDRIALFAVTRETGLRVKILPVGEERLRRDVERFLERVRSQDAPADLSRALYRLLIGPVADLVEKSERVLILPDGPLHRLPFGALLRDRGHRAARDRRDQYLTEWKPLHTALSLTVYGTLRASGRATPPREATAAARLVAFGDPHYPQNPGLNGRQAPAHRDWGLRSLGWAPLLYSRREVERIAEVYPGARLYLGEEATEEQAKSSTARAARVLHFATHGSIDDRNPLDSALVLSIPEGPEGPERPEGRDNGLLQVWEIFESVRLDADLVVLSACESALGRELNGEGLIGLTRAFQYAGARSVVASSWSVADQVTAELMVRFHQHLAAGLRKDEALRAAQIELIRQPIRITTANGQVIETDASAPFFWAAFQLFGDWQ